MLDTIFRSLIKGDAPGAAEGVRQALAAGVDPAEILNNGMIAAMTEVGRMYERGEVYIPEMLIASRAMKAGLAALRPRLVEATLKPVGTVVLGTVQGDLHDVGKNLVGIMLEGIGFKVLDLGVSVPAERFVAAAREHRPDFVGLSALITTTMPVMGEVIEALAAAGLRGDVRVMVGGAPITPAFAEEIGADLYAPDAASAASRAKALLDITATGG